MRADQPFAEASGATEELRAFVEEAPYEREAILAFVREAADSLPQGAVVIDVGAGNAPYAELFEHCEYFSTEWDGYVDGRVREVDIVACDDALPLPDATGDAVLLTNVLDRALDPGAVIREAARVLRPNGTVFLTVPFVRRLSEARSDRWRFAPAALERLLVDAGFVDARVEPLCDCFTTIASLLSSFGSTMGKASDGRDEERERVSVLLAELAQRIVPLASLDAADSLPLGWIASARRA